MTKVDLLLHPVRLRVVQALLGQEMTPQQLVDALGDVPQATLYRTSPRSWRAACSSSWPNGRSVG